jgi:ribosomal protein S28E/S33
MRQYWKVVVKIIGETGGIGKEKLGVLWLMMMLFNDTGRVMPGNVRF